MTPRARSRTLKLAMLATATWACLTGAAAADTSQRGSANQGGVRVEWTYTSAADDAGLGTLDVHTSDGTTGQPVRYDGGKLRGWLQRERAALSDGEIDCATRVKMLVSQGIGRRADIDLNEYRLLTLNSDGTLAFINPFVGLNNAKLESIVELKGTPRDWVEVLDRMELWVLLDGPPRLVNVDLQSRRIRRTVDLPAGSQPTGLALDRVAGVLSTVMPHRQEVASLAIADPDARLQTSAVPGIVGLSSLDLSQGLSGILLFDADGGVILRQGQAPAHRWHVGGRAVASGYSALAQRLIVATSDGELSWIDPKADGASAVTQTLRLGHAVEDLSLFDEGRRALAIGGGKGSVIDLASATVTMVLSTVEAADTIVLTDNFAYAASTRAGRATLWSLSDLRGGRNQPLDVMIGSPAPESEAARNMPRRTVAAPEGNGLLVASPADGLIYQYSEGMMAPTGSYSNYRRAALGLAVLDTSLREVSPGHYRASFRHESGGVHDLILAGIGPRFSSCARLALPAATGVPDEPVFSLKPVLIGTSGSDGKDSETVLLRLDRSEGKGRTDAVTGVADLTMLVFDKHSGWQRRIRLRETAVPGEYRATVKVPRRARYEMLVTTASMNLPLVEGRIGDVLLGKGAR